VTLGGVTMARPPGAIAGRPLAWPHGPRTPGADPPAF
jgi:hypothetical protein